MKDKKQKNSSIIWILLSTILLIIITAITGISLFRVYMGNFTEVEDVKSYDKYYVMITEDRKSSFWQSVYAGAYEAGLSENTYVDMLGDNLTSDYSREDLMNIAISSEVDGIIVAADESEQMSALIDEAAIKGIPVVTLVGDNTHSNRCSFVGVGGYNVGTEYGQQVLQIIKESEAKPKTKVSVLVNANALDSGQNIICSGIQDTLDRAKEEGKEIEMTLVSVDNTNAFSVEESIRDIFMEEDIPDIIICLNELNTTCVYQAVVDYNKVGEVSILGYYDSETIIKAIDRNVIYATVSIDTKQMGEFCVNALSEYHELGYTSQYFTADIELIKKANVHKYLEGGEDNE
ncbi:MAG: substrate-binding domain-containing protein [Lachnospiraceae bacterium]|nr:substrate-binding domain-containing protein [Lachnospiraceae bacterium]